MVAASPGGTKVSPDYLQVPPLLVFLSISAQEFAEYEAVSGRKPEPGKPRQHHASRKQAARMMLAAHGFELNVTGGVDPKPAVA